MSPSLDWLGAAAKFFDKYYPALWITAGFALLAPSGLLTALGVSSLTAQFRPWIGVFFLLTTAILLLRLVYWAKGKWDSRSTLKARQTQLHELTPAEKKVLRTYLEARTSSLAWDMGSGVVGGLSAKQILFMGAQASTDWGRWAYNVQPWAWKYLTEYPELVQDEAGDMDAVEGAE